MRSNDPKTFGAFQMLIADMAESISSCDEVAEQNFELLFKAVDAGLFRIDHEWKGQSVYFKVMFWSPSENMYKLGDDMCKFEDEAAEAALTYFMSSN